MCERALSAFHPITVIPSLFLRGICVNPRSSVALSPPHSQPRIYSFQSHLSPLPPGIGNSICYVQTRWHVTTNIPARAPHHPYTPSRAKKTGNCCFEPSNSLIPNTFLKFQPQESPKIPAK